MSAYEEPTNDQLDQLVGRALADADFRQRLLADPASAATELGITLLQEQIDHIVELRQSIGPALNHLAQGMSALLGIRDVDRW